MFKRVSAVAATALIAASLILSTVGASMAQPGPGPRPGPGPGRHHGGGGGGAAAAAVVGGVLGIIAAEAAREPRECRRECHWVPGECYVNDRGREVCRRGHKECERYCD